MTTPTHISGNIPVPWQPKQWVEWRWLIHCVVLGFIVALTAMFALPLVLQPGGLRVVVVNGHSMGQAVPDQSIVITRSVAGESLRIGDVVVFDAQWLEVDGTAKQVVHRLNVIAATPSGLMGYTSGDANVVADPLPIDLTKQQSLVVGVMPLAGQVFHDPWLVLVGLAAVGVISLSSLRTGMAGVLKLSRVKTAVSEAG